jgi:DNA repair protein RadC
VSALTPSLNTIPPTYGVSIMSAVNSTTLQAREDRAIYRAMKFLENRLKAPGQVLTSPDAVRQFLTLRLAGEEREVFTALWLDTQHRVITVDNLFYGTLSETSVYPREVVKRGLALNAAAVILAHNHPGGSPNPSLADKLITSSLQYLLGLMEMRILDHFIVGHDSVFSFAENGLMSQKDTLAEKEPPKPKNKTRKISAKKAKE